MKKKMIGISIKMIAIASAIYGIIMTYFSPMSFTYFTTLSNIFVCVMLIIALGKDIYFLVTKKELKMNNTFYIIKFLATISITLTFFVFLTILAPTIEGGIIHAYLSYHYGSLCLHFITPLLAIFDFLFFDEDYQEKNTHVFYAIIPPIIYVIFVVIASSMGLRWGTMAAPYNFLNYKAPTGWFGFNLSLLSWETLGIGVFYMIVFLSLLFIVIGKGFLWIRKKQVNKNKRK